MWSRFLCFACLTAHWSGFDLVCFRFCRSLVMFLMQNPSMQIIAAKGCFCRVNRKSLLQWIDYYSNLVAIEMRKWQEMGWVMRWSHSADWFSVPWNPFDRFLCIKHSASLHESLNFAENREQCQRTEYLLNGMRSLLYLLLIGLNIWQRFRSCLSFTPNAPSFRLNLDGKWFTW